jgi:calcium-dependent protein kinase
MDVSQCGVLSKADIKDGYSKLYGKNYTDAEMDAMFDAVDTDGSGMIEYSEFVVATLGEEVLLSEEKLIKTFKMFDKDGGGTISIDELKEVLAFGDDIDQETMDDIMKQAGDDEVTFKQFKVMMGLHVEEEVYENVLKGFLEDSGETGSDGL